jgi:hypothetical protein
MAETNSATSGSVEPRSRRFTVGDAMILIVALALWLALARPAIILIVDAVRREPHYRLRTWAGAVSLGRMINVVLLNFLFFFLPAFLILRLKRPRPPLRAAILQPGLAACAAVVVGFLVLLPFALLDIPGPAGGAIAMTGQFLLAFAPLLAWIALIVKGRWKPEANWIDRLGRVLGILWTICLPVHLLLIQLAY